MRQGTAGLGRIMIAAALACAGCVAIAPAAASAAPSKVSVYHHEPDSPDDVAYRNIEVRAHGADRQPHHITVRPDGTDYLISDSAGIYSAQPRPRDQQQVKCVQVDPTAIRCGLPDGGGIPAVYVKGGYGPDLIDLRGLTGLENSVVAGGGDDRLLGSPGPDFMIGGRDDDVLIGYLGQDVLMGERGNDVIRSRDGLTDQISCGSGDAGDEKAIRDRRDRKVKLSTGNFYYLIAPISC